MAILIFSSCTFSPQISTVSQKEYKLWYDRPAQVWTEALPLGNGRLGAMVFGGTNHEKIQLNECSLWSGGPVSKNPNPEAINYLKPIREALEKEDYALADEIAHKMQGYYTESFLPLGDLILDFDIDSMTTDYYRDLNITNATSLTKFKVGDTEYSRKMFISAPDQVMVLKLGSSEKNGLNFTAKIKSQIRSEIKGNSDNELVLSGRAPQHVDPSYLRGTENPVAYIDEDCKGMRFELRMKILTMDGIISNLDSVITLSGASKATIILSAATSFNGFDKCPESEGADESQKALAYLEGAEGKDYETLYENHVEDYHNYFNRTKISLGDTTTTEVPTNERLLSYTNGAIDPGLEELYFQYGRYLLISSSRPGGLPANLQGVWNPHMRPPWSSNYTININAEMNYWPAEVCNLSEMHEPMIRTIQNIAKTGKSTASIYYGTRGWCAHHNSDIWATSNPVGDLGGGGPMWANWPMGGVWLCHDLWEKYSFNQDEAYLKNVAYPIMKGAAEFCLDWMVEDENGYLITSPSTSPENRFKTEHGIEASVSKATTSDMSLIWDLFTNLISAEEILAVDHDFKTLLIEKKKKLFPLQVGEKGNLQEWYKDWEDPEPHHRHISHLIGLFPGKQISPYSNPEFAAAARQTLELRGDEGTGWSKAWKINTWARLLDGNRSYKLLRELIHYTSEGGTNYSSGGGTYPNLFCAHPPFQIDGNFGGISGMAEMVLQSHNGFVHILPALPDSWSKGKIEGLKAQGGFEVSFAWENKLLTGLTIKSLTGNTLRLMVPNEMRIFNGVSMISAEKNFLYEVQTQVGQELNFGF